MLKTLKMKKRLDLLRAEETSLRSKLSGLKTREGELAAQIEGAATEEDLSTVAAAVEELEATQKTAKDRLETIKEEIDALLADISAAEETAAAAAEEGSADPAAEPDADEARSVRSRSNPEFLRRCKTFQTTGKMHYRSAKSMLRRSALLSAGAAGPTGIGGLNDPAGVTVSELIDLVKVTDCTGMATYRVAYMVADSAAAAHTEGTVPTESEPTFAYVDLTPGSVALTSYISREIRKVTPLQYEEKIRESATRALRRKLNKMAVDAVVASTLNTTFPCVAPSSASSGAALFTPSLLSDLILSYGGDEGIDGAAVLVLNKADLRAFAAVRGENEYLPVYSIIPDATNPSTGIIKDNNGLSCRYCLNADVTALSGATLSTTAQKTMFYGNPQCLELAMWGGVDLDANDGYKFGEGLITIRGEVTADADVTVKNGFVIVTGAKSAT